MDTTSAPDWYADWRHDAFHQLMEKQDKMAEIYGTNTLPRYDYDVDAGTLTFSENGIVKVIADIQVVGTTSDKDWLWGWANDWWPQQIVSDLEAVVGFGEQHGIMELTSGYVSDDDLNNLGWQLTAVAVRILDAVAAYRPPSSDRPGALFLLIKSIRHAS